MKRAQTVELTFLFSVIGLVATFAAPWYELRGTYAAWRIVEWHTFWRGAEAFQLTSVVASNFRVPIEYATSAMQNALKAVTVVGWVVGAWQFLVLAGLFIIGARERLRAGVAMWRVMLEIVGLVMLIVAVLFGLAFALALPSSLTQKVEFRTTMDIHTNTLIWSDLNWMPIASALSMIAVVGQLFVFATWLKKSTR